MSNRRTFLHLTRRAAFSWSAALALLWGSLACASQRVEIDVMVAFDQGALGIARQSPEEMAQIAVQNLNQVLVRSKLDEQVHFRLVKALSMPDYLNSIASRQLQILQTYAQSRGMTVEELLQNLQLVGIDEQTVSRLVKAESDGYKKDYDNILAGRVPGLKSARDEAKADMVLLSFGYIALNLHGMGYGFHQVDEIFANAGATPALHPDFLAEKQYVAEFDVSSTIQPFDGMDVFSHETMHVLGCGHADRQKSGPGPFYYADSTGYFTPEAKYSSIMCYPFAHEKVPLPNVSMTPGNSRCINCLSGPYNPRLMGTDARLADLPAGQA